MTMKTYSIMLILAATIAATGACGKKEEPTRTSAAPAEVPNVATAKVGKTSISDFYEATGTVKAKTTTQVSANILGRIVSIPFVEGDTVARGQVLVEIDNREAQAQIQKAEAGLREAEASLTEIDRAAEAAEAGVRTAETNRQLAETTFGRIKELYDRRSASAQEFDEARSRAKAADSELERAKAGVQAIVSRKKQVSARIEQARADIANSRVYAGYAKIVSPVSGVIVKKFAEAGATASPGTPLLAIEDNSVYRLEAAVEETRSKFIRPGTRVGVRIDAIGEGEFPGTVSEVLPSADAATRTYLVKIDIPANGALRSGLYGVARFPVGQKEAIAVPETALTDRGQLRGAYVIGPDGLARFRIVTTGKTSEGMVEVLSGLSEGDEIAISDTARLADGVKIR